MLKTGTINWSFAFGGHCCHDEVWLNARQNGCNEICTQLKLGIDLSEDTIFPCYWTTNNDVYKIRLNKSAIYLVGGWHPAFISIFLLSPCTLQATDLSIQSKRLVSSQNLSVRRFPPVDVQTSSPNCKAELLVKNCSSLKSFSLTRFSLYMVSISQRHGVCNRF